MAVPRREAQRSCSPSRLFKPDPYPDRRAATYSAKLRYPFRWTDVLSALDAILLIDPAPNQQVNHALAWLAARQDEQGLWRSACAKAADPHVHHWTSFAAARVFRRAYSDHQH